MRFSLLVVTALGAPSVDAFSVHPSIRSTTVPPCVTELKMQQFQKGFFGSAAAALVGVTFFGQVASASIPEEAIIVEKEPIIIASTMPDQSDTVQTSPASIISSLSEIDIIPNAPTIITSAGFGSVETMDFSLPSYEESTKGTAAVPKKDTPPSFNPFGDFQPEIVKSDGPSAEEKAAAKAEEKAAAEAKKAEDKAAAEARKAEDKAAAEARKAEEKAAAEAKKAEEKAAKEAKRQEELEKQKEAVEARKKREEEPAATTANVPAPAVTVPEAAAPKIPEFKAPEVSIPDFKAPEMPKFAMPENVKIDMPKFDKIDMPKFDKMEMPKIDMPAISVPSFGSDDKKPPKEYAPQEVRDEAAREARLTYLKYDEIAKEKEAEAREARGVARDKLELAKEAKDLACETRPGGKLICVRNPFTAGF